MLKSTEHLKPKVNPNVTYGLLPVMKCQLRFAAAAAAATAKSLQSCPTLCDPIDGSPPGSPVPVVLQARILEWVAISFCDLGSQLETNAPFRSGMLIVKGTANA